jgi:hypothetical protein
MLEHMRKHHRAVGQLAIFSLLFQLVLMAFHMPALRAAQNAAGDIPAGYTLICSGTALQLVAVGPDGQPSGDRIPGVAPIKCPICLTHAAGALAIIGDAAIPAPALAASSAAEPRPSASARDHRPAIRPGHDPPLSL